MVRQAHPVGAPRPRDTTPPSRSPGKTAKAVLVRGVLTQLVVILGLLPCGGAFAGPDPEPAPAPTALPEQEPAPTAVLVVNTTILTEQPHSGSTVKAQVWVTATGAPAPNATLLLDPGDNATLIPQCTLVPANGTACKLGDLDAQGVTIPLSISTPRSAAIRVITLTATATADPDLSTQLKTAVTLAPATATPTPKPTTPKPAEPKPTKTTRSPKPAKTPASKPAGSPSVSAAPAVPPAAVPTAAGPPPYTPTPSGLPAASSTPPVVLPQIAPAPTSAFPDEGIPLAVPTPLPSITPLSDRSAPLSTGLTAAHGLWLGALLTAVLVALFARRRGSAKRTSPDGRRTAAVSRSDRRRGARGIRGDRERMGRDRGEGVADLP